MSWITRVTLFVVTAAILIARLAEWKLAPSSFGGRTIDVELWFGDRGFHFPDLAQAAQIQIDRRLDMMNVASDIRVRLVDNLVVSKAKRGEEALIKPNVSPDIYTIVLRLSQDMGIQIDGDKLGWLQYNPASIDSNDLPYFICQATLDHLLRNEVKAKN